MDLKQIERCTVKKRCAQHCQPLLHICQTDFRMPFGDLVVTVVYQSSLSFLC